MSEEWIEWKGGECPVPPETRVDVKTIDGEEYYDEIVGSNWWKHHGISTDIIAYRLHEEPTP